MKFHTPVLLNEVINCLEIQSGKTYIDGTLGHGGHSIEILKLGATVYALDQDPTNLKLATNRIKKLKLDQNFFPIHANFSQIKQIYQQNIKQKVDGIILDLGLSQNQQTAQNRGFSFNDPSSLDMRIDPQNQSLTAEEIINTYNYEQLFDIFSKYAQEKLSKPLAQKIISQRQKKPIKTAVELADIIRQYYQDRHIKTQIDPATKIFLSLKIVVNNEFDNLKKFLNDSLNIINKNSPICIISFHSGEDRIIKQFSQKFQHKKILPTLQEIKSNPLSRSAILRSYKIV